MGGMGHSYDLGWDTKPKLDEARVLAPETPPHRSRKNTRRWCKGKPGVEHQPAMKLSSSAVYMLTRHGSDNPHAVCGWRDWPWLPGAYRMQGKGEWSWACKHVYACTECGKVLSHVDAQDCPEWEPR